MVMIIIQCVIGLIIVSWLINRLIKAAKEDREHKAKLNDFIKEMEELGANTRKNRQISSPFKVGDRVRERKPREDSGPNYYYVVTSEALYNSTNGKPCHCLRVVGLDEEARERFAMREIEPGRWVFRDQESNVPFGMEVDNLIAYNPAEYEELFLAQFDTDSQDHIKLSTWDQCIWQPRDRA
jgi:hypothetical protein